MALRHAGFLNSITGRPFIAFEYSEEAIHRGLDLSYYLLPLKGEQLRKDFPAHQKGLPSPIYDTFPDGWGALAKVRVNRAVFKIKILNS